MPTRQVLVPTTPTRLSDLLDSDNLADGTCQGIGMQAAGVNVGIVFFGDNAQQVQELIAGASVLHPVNTPRNVWVRSENGTELLNVTLTI